jgi:hypothetical protein
VASFANQYSAKAILVEPDDRILVGGDFIQLGTAAISGLGRLLPDGFTRCEFHPDTSSRISAATFIAWRWMGRTSTPAELFPGRVSESRGFTTTGTSIEASRRTSPWHRLFRYSFYASRALLAAGAFQSPNAQPVEFHRKTQRQWNG